MKNLQSLLPALIIALAVLAGLLGGAKIISDGVIQANRFQLEEWEKGVFLFDSLSGGAFSFKSYSNNWHSLGGNTDNF